MRNWTQPAIAASIGELFVVFALIFFPPPNLSPGPKNYEQAQPQSDRSADKKNHAADSVPPDFRVIIGSFLDEHNGAIAAIGTMVTAFLTAYLTVYNGQMVRTIRLQREDAQKISERQTGETQEQINIAKNAAKHAEESLPHRPATMDLHIPRYRQRHHLG